MGSKFFGNRTEKKTTNKKGVKQNFNNKSSNAKSGGVRKTGRGSQSFTQHKKIKKTFRFK